MRVAVIYDFGVNRGGGDFVMLNILRALNDAGYDPTLITSIPSGLREAAELFDDEASDVNVKYIKVPSFFKHPYSIAYMARKAKKERYDLYVFSDDVPKCMNSERIMCYVHYPHVARIKHPEFVAEKYKTSIYGRMMWFLHKHLFPRFFEHKNISSKWLLLVNSSLTYSHVSKLLSTNRVTLLYPPVDVKRIIALSKNSQKENLVIAIGRFEPERRYEDLIYALKKVKAKCKLLIIGFSYDDKYVEHLKKIIKNMDVMDKVELLLNADRELVLSKLVKAKVIVHTAIREPFGISIVEGMASGCIPVIRQGFNGPWIDITQSGRYGIGFKSIDELATSIENVLHNYERYRITYDVVDRALYFDAHNFRTRFLYVLHKTYDSCSSLEHTLKQ